MRPPLPTRTQELALAQETAKRDFAFGIFAGTQELGPSPGLVVVQTPPLKSTAMQSEEVGQEIPRRLPFRFSPRLTWPIDQAVAPAVGAVDWTITPSEPTPMQKPLASQCMPKIVSVSPRLRLVWTQGEACALAAPNEPRAAIRAKRSVRRRTDEGFI